MGVSWYLDFSRGLAASSICVLKAQGRHSRASSNLGLEVMEHRSCCVLQSMWDSLESVWEGLARTPIPEAWAHGA